MRRQRGATAVETALRERVKELTCLYEIAQLAARPGITAHELLSEIANSVRNAWQYPEITSVRISIDGSSHDTPGFRDGPHRQSAPIVISEAPRGRVEVVYAEDRPELDEGPFLHEERNLINAVAAQIASIVQGREAQQERLDLQNQLRHADRLATIGQLAAGVAHELNEPLGNILGFAQLAEKCPGLPDQGRADIEKITAASLRAREIIKKLLAFARQSSPDKTKVDVNLLVQEGLYFFQARCAKQGIDLDLALAPDLPAITADGSQLTQVLVNLVVNAVQAMPDGGRLTVGTRAAAESVLLVVEDTGIGMSEEIVKKLFVPFFTTKDIGQGTGLGLAVAHGIVRSHGGRIEVQSAPGQGTRFEVWLPLSPREDLFGTVGSTPEPDGVVETS
jgi:two-component system NtrC family sensor kinase